MTVDLPRDYRLLRSRAGRTEPIQYGDLSCLHKRAIGDWIDPQLAWSQVFDLISTDRLRRAQP
jgi:hypothetical protein